MLLFEASSTIEEIKKTVIEAIQKGVKKVIIDLTALSMVPNPTHTDLNSLDSLEFLEDIVPELVKAAGTNNCQLMFVEPDPWSENKIKQKKAVIEKAQRRKHPPLKEDQVKQNVAQILTKTVEDRLSLIKCVKTMNERIQEPSSSHASSLKKK